MSGSDRVSMATVNAIIFDLDGCLVDSEPLCLAAIAEEMREIGIVDATADEIGERFLGVSFAEIVRYAEGRLGHTAPLDFANRVEARLFDVYQTELRRIPGTIELLSALHAQAVGLAIATGGSLLRMKTTLRIAGLEGWFGGTQCSAEEVSRGKPAPDVFELALARLGVSAGDCLVVEDSPHGIAGAVSAGIPAVGFVGGSHLDGRRSGHAQILRDAGALTVFDNVSDFQEFLFVDA